MTTKGARGEAILTVGDREIPILFVNQALGDAEMQLGKSMSVLALAIRSGELGVRDTAVLLQVGMEYGRRAAKILGRRITLDDAYKVIDDLGFLPVAGTVALAMTECLTYDASEETEDEGEDDRPPE